MERKDLQQLIGVAIEKALAEAGVTQLDGDHVRRLIRVLLRAASRLVIEAGAPLAWLAATSVEAFLQEVQTQSPAKVPALGNVPADAN